MFNFLQETFLREYFTFVAILGDNCPNREVFDLLAKNFDIPTQQANGLFELTEQQAVREITTEADANRYKRIVQFQAISNKPVLYDEQTDATIAIKTEAITTATHMDLCMGGNASKSKVYQTLLDKAGSGNVEAMRVLGTLQCSGLFVEASCPEGRENLAKAAKWGDVISMFTLLRTGVKSYELSNNFYFATRNTPYSALFKIVNSDKFVPDASKAGILLLNRLFAQKTVNRAVYSHPHAHVIYASAISNEDKEKMLFSENKQLLSDALNLPINKPVNVSLRCDLDAIKQMPLNRPSEQNQIISALRNRDLRALATYRPLCLCANSVYLQDLFASALQQSFSNETVQVIDVNCLQELDMEPTANNVFVRSCKRVPDGVDIHNVNCDTNSVFLMFLNGEIPASIIRHVKTFLSTEWRRQFRLARPAVTLDFSCALPICICDDTNANKLKTLVETIRIAEVDSAESTKLIGEMLEQKAKLYFGKSVELTDNAMELLSKLPLENVEEIVDTAFRAQRDKFDGKDKVAFAIKPYVDSYNSQHQQRVFGFGGNNK